MINRRSVAIKRSIYGFPVFRGNLRTDDINHLARYRGQLTQLRTCLRIDERGIACALYTN